VFNKADIVAEDPQDRVARILRSLRWKKPWYAVSALTGAGCDKVCRDAAKFLAGTDK
jgi:Ni2+-binding GTPase involved in maturation of urease and hydrogenase